MELFERPEDEVLCSTAVRLLADGPLPIEDLVDGLQFSGCLEHLEELDSAERTEEVVAVLECSDAFHEAGDLVASTAHLLDGLALTHLITGSELETGLLALTPDLDVIDFDGDGRLRMSDGSSSKVVFPADNPSADENGSLAGSHGWLSAIPGPGLAVVRRRNRELTVEAVDELADGAPELEGLRRALADRDPELAFEPSWVVLDALTVNDGLFRDPTRPISVLLDELGYESRGAWFGPRDRPWVTPGERYLEGLAATVSDRWDFESCCAEAFAIARSAWSDSLGHRQIDQPTRRAASRALLHQPVSEAFVDFALHESKRGTQSLAEFAGQLIDQPQSLRAPGHYLSAMNSERNGEVEEAESQLAEAVLLDPEYAAALYEYAWYVADRGDAVRARSLSERAGMGPGHPEYEYLADQVTDAAAAKVGRNDPCPCGSGKRFKQCCLNGATMPVERRAGWLGHKLERFAIRPAFRFRIEEMAEIFEQSEVELTEDTVAVLVDLVAFEPEVIQEFIDTRGVLLPADERLLLEDWKSRARLDLFEVVAVQPGATITVRNTRTGEDIVVTERTASRTLQPNTYIVTRIAAAGSQHQIVGALLPITLWQRQSAMELLDRDYASWEVAQWLARLGRPPTMQNREGDELVMCSTTLRPVGMTWEELGPVLDRTFEPGPEGTWHQSVDVGGEAALSAVLRRDGTDLIVETNSIRRDEQVMGWLHGLDGVTFRLVDSVKAPLDEIVAAKRRQASGEPGWDDDDDDEEEDSMSDEDLRQMMETMIIEQERKWTEEPVPALGGLSPRQALDDPTRREDLLALLAEFERLGRGARANTTFDVGRIRGRLGL